MPDQSIPCIGEGDLTLVLNGNQREVTNDNTSHFGESITGTWTAVLDAGGASAGRFTMTYGETVRSGSEDVNMHGTFRGVVLSGVGAGIRWHTVEHFIGPVGEENEVIEELARVHVSRVRCH